MTLPIIRRLPPALLALLWSPLLAAAPPPRSLQDARKEIAVRQAMEEARSRLRAEAPQQRLIAKGDAWAISGTVRSSLDASPVEDINVSIFDERGGLLATTATFPDGTYSFSALVDGTYHVQADGSPVHVSDGIHAAAGGLPCPGFCDPTGGDPVVVSGASVVGVDLLVTPWGTLTGHVQNAIGDAIPGVTVTALLADGPDRGGALGSADTDASGDYSLAVLPGSYRVKASRTAGYTAESYDDLEPDVCEGDVVTVAPGATTSGVDFELASGGAISGQILRASGDSPSGIDVIVRNVLDTVSFGTVAAGDGSYALDGLRDGRYFVYTYGDFRNEEYDDVPCEPICFPPAHGSWIEILAGSSVSGIDIVLGEGDGSISGTVTSALDMSPLAASVDLYDGSGRFLDSYSAASGTYAFTDLAPGSYFVKASDSGFVDQLYSGTSCEPTCDVTTGTPISVSATISVTGVDLELDPLASISGQILIGGLPPSSSSLVFLYDAAGVQIAVRGGSSSYSFPGLQAGDYFVRIRNRSAVDEVWDDQVCFGCDPTTGTAVSVPAATAVANIDFDLAPGSCVAGTVSDASSGLGVPRATVTLQLDGTSKSVETTTDALGNYLLCGLPAGSYEAFARGVGHLEEQYDEGTATLLPLTGTGVTRDVDFTLTPGGTISGRVTGEVLTMFGALEQTDFALLQVYDAGGTQVASGLEDALCPYYRIGPLATGSYFVRASALVSDVTPALYDSIPCDGCDPTTGTPVAVTVGAETTGIDLHMTVKGLLFASSFEGGSTADWSSARP